MTEQNMAVIKELKTFYFYFDWPKNVDEILKRELEFIIKSSESLAENKIKTETEQLQSKYEHGNYVHEHEKQQNE